MKNKMFAYIRPLAALAVLKLFEDFMKYSFADFSPHEQSRISFKFLPPFTARITVSSIVYCTCSVYWNKLTKCKYFWINKRVVSFLSRMCPPSPASLNSEWSYKKKNRNRGQ